MYLNLCFLLFHHIYILYIFYMKETELINYYPQNLIKALNS